RRSEHAALDQPDAADRRAAVERRREEGIAESERADGLARRRQRHLHRRDVTWLRGHHNKTRFRMRAGVVDTSNGPYFIKLTGPEQTVAKWDAAFNQFVSSFRLQ